MTGPKIQSATLSDFAKQLSEIDKTIQGLAQHFGTAGQAAQQFFGSASQASGAVGLMNQSSGLVGPVPAGVAAGLGGNDFTRALNQVRLGESAANPMLAMARLQMLNEQRMVEEHEQALRNMQRAGTRGPEYKLAKTRVSAAKSKLGDTTQQVEEFEQIQALESVVADFQRGNPNASDRDIALYMATQANPSVFGMIQDKGAKAGALHRFASQISYEEAKSANQVAAVAGGTAPSSLAAVDPYAALRGKSLYTAEDRMLAAQGVALGGGRALGVDLTDVAAARSAAGAVDIGGLTATAARATGSEDKFISALGRELKTLTASFEREREAFKSAVQAAADAMERAASGGEAEQKAAEKATRELKDATIRLTNAQEAATKLQKSIQDSGGGGGGGPSKEEGGWKKLMNIGGAIAGAAVAGIATQQMISAAFYTESAGKERSVATSQMSLAGLAESRMMERADLTNPANLLKHYGDILAPGRFQFLGQSGRANAAGIAEREISDLRKAAYHTANAGQIAAAAQVGGGSITAGVGIVGAAKTAGLSLIPAAAGIQAAASGTQTFFNIEATNADRQARGGVAARLGDERRAALNMRAVELNFELQKQENINNLQNMEVQTSPAWMRMLTEYQNFQGVQEQGATLVGKYAWRREDMLNALYGDRRVTGILGSGQAASRGVGRAPVAAKSAPAQAAATPDRGTLAGEFVNSVETVRAAGQKWSNLVGGGILGAGLETANAAIRGTVEGVATLGAWGAHKVFGESGVMSDEQRIEREQWMRDYKKTHGGLTPEQFVAKKRARAPLAQAVATNLPSAPVGSQDYPSDTQEVRGPLPETAASRLGMTPSEFAAHSNMLTNVLGNRPLGPGDQAWAAAGGRQIGIQASVADTANMAALSRSGVGSFSQLMGNLGSLNQVSGGQNNMAQLESVLGSAVAAGFDKSRTAQQFVQTSVGIADALRLTNVQSVSGTLATAATLTSGVPGMADERGLRMAAEGIKGYNAWAGQQTGVQGAFKVQSMLEAGANASQIGILKNVTISESAEMLKALDDEKAPRSPTLDTLIRSTGGDRASAKRILQALHSSSFASIETMYGSMQYKGKIGAGSADKDRATLKAANDAMAAAMATKDEGAIAKARAQVSDTQQEIIAKYGTAAGQSQMDVNMGRQMGVQSLISAGLVDQMTGAELLKKQKEMAPTVDPARIKASQFIGAIMREGQGSMALGKDKGGIAAYKDYLEQGGANLVAGVDTAMLNRWSSGKVAAAEQQQFEEFGKLTRYDMAKGMEYRMDTDAQPVRIANADAVAISLGQVMARMLATTAAQSTPPDKTNHNATGNK